MYVRPPHPCHTHAPSAECAAQKGTSGKTSLGTLSALIKVLWKVERPTSSTHLKITFQEVEVGLGRASSPLTNSLREMNLELMLSSQMGAKLDVFTNCDIGIGI